MSDTKKFILLAAVAAALAIGAQLAGVPFGGPPPANAHASGWCAHGTKSWTVWSYGQQVYYREVFLGDTSSGGNHIHRYRTDGASGLWEPWRVIHYHDRVCNLS